MIKIAKIVKSNSHVDYVARVIDRLDVSEPPRAIDYGFAQFVSIPLTPESEIIGIIYNTLLANPEYGSFGPRLSSHAELAVLSPDYLNEQGVLVGILLLGWRGAEAAGAPAVNHQAVPRSVIPVGQDVYRLTAEGVQQFHKPAEAERASTAGTVRLHYYSQIIAHAGAFAVPLIEAVIEQLESGCSKQERQQLCVLKRSLVWQRTLGGVRL